jgi:hypothetical protein
LITGVGMALAAPIIGLVSPLLSVRKQNSSMKAHGTAHTAAVGRFHVEFENEPTAALSTQVGAYAAAVKMVDTPTPEWPS